MSNVYHNSFFAMNTRFHLLLPGLDADKADQIFHVIKREVNRIETKLSRFIPVSDVSVINQKASNEPVLIDDEMTEILSLCKRYYRLTNEAFDITLRPLMNCWKQKKPDSVQHAEIIKLLECLGTDSILLDQQAGTVRFENDALEIDLGGFGKGYALEKVNDSLKDFKVENAFISFGESSVLTLGRHPAGSYWKVGLNDYRNPGKTIYEFAMKDACMSTSGNFYVDDDGTLHNHRHVIDPFSGYPVEKCMTVSVCSNSALESEILSTALLVCNDSGREAMQNKRLGIEVVKVDYSKGIGVVSTFDCNGNKELNEV